MMGRRGLLTLVAVLAIPSLSGAQNGEFDIKAKCDKDFQVALEYWRSRQIPDAHELFTTVVEACPDYVEAYFYKGRCETDMKQYEEAVRTFRGGLDVDPNHVGIRENLAFALLQSGDQAGGIEIYRGLIKDNPDNIDYWLRMSHAANEVGRGADAIMAAAEAVELRADSLGLWKTLDYYFSVNKAVVPSLQTGEKIHLREPDNIPVLSRLGAAYARAHRYERAIPIYEDLYSRIFPKDGSPGIEFDKRRANDMWQYATVLKGVKQYAEAARVFDKVLENEAYANNASAHVNLAFIYKDAKMFDDCIRVANRALEIEPQNASAMCALAKGQEGKALEAEKSKAFDRAIGLIMDARGTFQNATTAAAPGTTWFNYATAEIERMDKHLTRLRQEKSLAAGD